MPLQKDTISIDLARGVDSKVDDKIAGPNQSSVLRDARFDKDKRLVKRNGLTAQGTLILTSFPNPQSIATGLMKSKVIAHENQLCIQNGGAFYSQYEGQNAWSFKGQYFPLGVKSTTIKSGVLFTDSVTTSGMTALAGGGQVYLREDATGNIISTNAVSNILRLVAFSNSIWVLWLSTNTLKAQKINLSDGSLAAAINLKIDIDSSSTAATVFVANTTAGSLAGELAFVFYRTNASGMSVVPFDTTGSVPALGTLSVGVNSTPKQIYIESSVSANAFYLMYGNSGAGPTNIVKGYTFTASTYTNAFTTGTIFSSATTNPSGFGATPTQNSVMCLSPITPTDLWVFTSVNYPDPVTLLQSTTTDALFYYAVVNASGTITTAATLYGRGCMIVANAIRDTARKSIYLPGVFITPLQASYVLMDVLKGRSDTTTWLQAKWLYGFAALSGAVSQCIPTGDVYRFTNNGNLIDIDLSPDSAASAQYYAKTTHLTGGFLWAYDGQTIAEHNFFFAPEITQAWAGRQGATLTINQVGDAGHGEVFTLQFGPACAMTLGGYIAFSATSGAPKDWYIWYTVDGSGANPAPGGRTAIPVALLSTDNANEVAWKTQQAISVVVSSSQFSLTLINGGYLGITALNVGAVTAPSNSLGSTNGQLSAGGYQYLAVWKWTDRNGQVYRSAPSVPVTVTAAANDAGYFLINCPAITNKNFADVVIEVYRTQANGSEFQLASSANVFTNTRSRASFQDQFLSDAALSSNTILYTNGGILENAPTMVACSALSSFKERLVINSVDDPFAVYYSKTLVAGEPINFTQETFFRVDADKDGVTALAQMDDKLCVFKPKLVYVMSGDGADDLGNNSSFSPPMAIASDVGSSYPNSIVLYPNGLLFKSNKGIYSLNRALGVQYTGAAVETYNSNAISGAVLMDSLNEIRFPLSDINLALVYNYLFDRWDYFTNYQADSACLWQNSLALVTNAGVSYVEGSNYYDINTSGTHIPYGVYLETVWLKLKGVQDFQRVYEVAFLGEYLSPHTLNVNISYDYDPTVANSRDYFFDATTIIGGAGSLPDDHTYQFNISPATQKCQSIKFKITETPGTGTQQSLVLNDLSMQVGLKTGLNKMKASKGI